MYKFKDTIVDMLMCNFVDSTETHLQNKEVKTHYTFEIHSNVPRTLHQSKQLSVGDENSDNQEIKAYSANDYKIGAFQTITVQLKLNRS